MYCYLLFVFTVLYYYLVACKSIVFINFSFPILIPWGVLCFIHSLTRSSILWSHLVLTTFVNVSILLIKVIHCFPFNFNINNSTYFSNKLYLTSFVMCMNVWWSEQHFQTGSPSIQLHFWINWLFLSGCAQP